MPEEEWNEKIMAEDPSGTTNPRWRGAGLKPVITFSFAGDTNPLRKARTKRQSREGQENKNYHR